MKYITEKKLNARKPYAYIATHEQPQRLIKLHNLRPNMAVWAESD